jgi:hypothetical protein
MKTTFFALCCALCCTFAVHSQETTEWTTEKILLSDNKKLLELKDTLMELRYNLDYPFSVRWSCMLALARLGDKESINEILSKVSSKEIDNRMIYVYYPDLIYTRQRKLYDFLIERMMDKKAMCNSANPNTSVKIDCGYRIAEMLAPAIKDFPQRSNSKTAKKWLETSRKWCKKQNGKYRILAE